MTFLYFNFLLFLICVLSFMVKPEEIIMIIICAEVAMIAVEFNIILQVHLAEDLYGYVILFSLFTLSAIETAILLSLFCLYKKTLYFKTQTKIISY